MKKWILVVGCCLLFLTSLAQTYRLPPKTHYNRAVVALLNFERFEVKDLQIAKDSIHFISLTGHPQSLSLRNVNYIRVREGTNALNGALLSGGTMLVFSVATIMSVANDPTMQVSENAAGLTVFYTFVGATVGGLIGSLFVRQRSYYVHAGAN